MAEDLLLTGPPPRDLLADKGFNGKAFVASQAARGTAVLIPPARGQRASMAPILRKIVAEWRNRVEAISKEITDQMELARHGAHVLGPAHPDRSHHRGSHSADHVPHRGVDQPT